MAINKKGTLTVTSGGTAQNLNLGFTPSYLLLVNKTKMAATTDGVVRAEWWDDMANASSNIWTTSGGDGTVKITQISSNGVTPVQTADASLWTETNLTITGISKAAQAVVTATNSLQVGDIVSFHGVKGMTQINTLVGTVQSATGSNFTVNINTSSFSAYTSGGVANVIAGANYELSSGAQGNAGIVGVTLGTSLMVTTDDVWEYLAVLDTPVTS